MAGRKRITVQGVDSEAWGLLGALARMQRRTIGTYLTQMIMREWKRVMGPLPGTMREEEKEQDLEEKDDKDRGDPENLP